jgi:mRNA-degrading endonuclease toxin of MazEF toxin-antitoxin module
MGLLKDDTVRLKQANQIVNETLELLKMQDSENVIEFLEWIKNKAKMRYNLENEKKFPLFSKGIYYADLGKNIGAELEKDRPFILLSGSKESETVIIIPISDDDKYKGSTFWYHIPLSSGDTALVEQIRTISKTRIRRPIRKGKNVRAILPEECKKINEAIEKLKIFVPDK